MFTRMAVFAAVPDFGEKGGDVCLWVATPGGEELGPELAAGEGVVPQEAKVMGDVFEDGGGEDVGLFFELVIGQESDAAGTVVLLAEHLAVRAVPFGEVVPFQGAEGEAIQAV
jgi:hypothetical protein